jgi:transposase InsO family protein
LFGLSKQAYYKTIKNDHQKAIAWQLVKPGILEMRRSMPRLGTRKLHYLLGERAIHIGRDRLFGLLRKEGMLVPTRKKYVRTTNSIHRMFKYPNLVREIELVRPEQLWVADITYLDSKAEGNLYLHLVTDAYSKQIMGYELCDNMTAASTHKAFRMALSKRQYRNMPLIHHSDRGLQYCSSLYTECLKANNIAISMTENGDPYENAVAERINGILKDEFGLGDQLNNIREATKQVEQGIFAYNYQRPHLSCNMRTPIQMHAQQTMKIKTYKQKDQTSLVDV